MSKRLLFSLTKKDFRVDTFRSGGKGGQSQNKVNSGVRITHLASGAIGEARDTRSQTKNKKAAIHRLVKSPKFRVWHNARCHEILSGKTIEEQVEEAMDPKNIKVEVRGSTGKWESTPKSL